MRYGIGTTIASHTEDDELNMYSHRRPALTKGDQVHLTALGRSEAEFLGQITYCSALSIRFLADQALKRGGAVKLEWRNILLLGEVQDCQREGNGFEIGLNLEHALYHTEELARLARRLLAQDSRLEEIEQWSGPSEK